MRDQLWAEALQRFQDGDIWYLTGEVLQQAEEEQAARVEVDPWTTPILAYLKSHLLRTVKYKGREVAAITTNELLEFALELEMQYWTSGSSRRVAAILRLHGWHYERVENPLKDEKDQPRQIKAFICETDESDTSPTEKASVSTSPPHKTLLETDETDETDYSYMYKRRKGKEKKEGEGEGFTRNLGVPSISMVSSDSNDAIPYTSIGYNETDEHIGPNSISLTPSRHRSQTLPASPDDDPWPEPPKEPLTDEECVAGGESLAQAASIDATLPASNGPAPVQACPQCRCTSLFELGAYRKCPLCRWKGKRGQADEQGVIV